MFPTRPALLAASIAMVAVPALAQTEQGGARAKTVLQHIDYPGHGYATEIVRVDVPAGARAPLHQHPGIESGYVVKGGGTVYIKGRKPIVLKAGESTVVPPNTPHWFQNGSEPSQMISTYVYESGKPLTVNLPAK